MASHYHKQKQKGRFCFPGLRRRRVSGRAAQRRLEQVRAHLGRHQAEQDRAGGLGQAGRKPQPLVRRSQRRGRR